MAAADETRAERREPRAGDESSSRLSSLHPPLDRGAVDVHASIAAFEILFGELTTAIEALEARLEQHEARNERRRSEIAGLQVDLRRSLNDVRYEIEKLRQEAMRRGQRFLAGLCWALLLFWSAVFLVTYLLLGGR